MEISVTKSQVVAPEEDAWIVADSSGAEVLSLSQVIHYKYLGIEMYDSMAKTCSERQNFIEKIIKKVIKTV